eukprot:gb/GFBE01020534.1/.p1 GENE.gb/GFBE01020534.1/~~gb/GFBE01020534.1/.p1  ORF type:complete len:108 (+),score=22.62 gb/GFBE01020534.1/:1-324(+)
MARSSSMMLPVAFVLAALALFFGESPVFVPSASPRTETLAQTDVALRFAAAVPAAVGAPLAASAADAGLPTPVLGIGMLSVIVVIVLIVSGIVIARGLLDDETGGEL